MLKQQVQEKDELIVKLNSKFDSMVKMKDQDIDNLKDDLKLYLPFKLNDEINHE